MEERSRKSVWTVNIAIIAVGLFLLLWLLASDAHGQNVFRPQNDVNGAISWEYPNAQYDVWVQEGGAIQINVRNYAVRVSVIDALSINDYGDMRGFTKYVDTGSRQFNVPPGRYRVIVDRKGKSMEGVWLGVLAIRPTRNHNPNRF